MPLEAVGFAVRTGAVGRARCLGSVATDRFAIPRLDGMVEDGGLVGPTESLGEDRPVVREPDRGGQSGCDGPASELATEPGASTIGDQDADSLRGSDVLGRMSSASTRA